MWSLWYLQKHFVGKKVIQPCNGSGRERETFGRWVLCVLQVYRRDGSVMKALVEASEDLSCGFLLPQIPCEA